MTAEDAAHDPATNGPTGKVSLTMGHSESESTEVTVSSIHRGGVLAGGTREARRYFGQFQSSLSSHTWRILKLE
jgi:hypothetical protein